jgi:hypothetical protein
VKAFVLIDNNLYKRGATGILMRCILGDQGHELLKEIHAGTCGHHTGPRTLVRKGFRQGFYWSTAVAISEDIVRRCEVCQSYAKCWRKKCTQRQSHSKPNKAGFARAESK